MVWTTLSTGIRVARQAGRCAQPMPSGSATAKAAKVEPATSSRWRSASVQKVSARTAYSCITDRPSQIPLASAAPTAASATTRASTRRAGDRPSRASASAISTAKANSSSQAPAAGEIRAIAAESASTSRAGAAPSQ